MTRLTWDNVGSRRFETGVDRGVLYLPNGSAVPWNGITGVDEEASNVNVSETYLDGVKYLTTRTPGDFAGTLRAITYPDEFLAFDGLGEFNPGLFASDQRIQGRFSLSYRTRVGNDALADASYKIHILYNLVAKPSNKTYTSVQQTADPIEFTWAVFGTPMPVLNFRPTCHVIIDTARLRAGVLVVLENALYGTAGTAPSLPDPATLITLQQSVP